MKLKKSGVMIIVVGFAVLLVIAVAIGLSMYSSSELSRHSLLTRYFRVLSANDLVGIEELTASNFSSDLPVSSLRPGSYELYDFGETTGSKSSVQRFLLVVDAGQDGKSAYLADMEYERKLFGTDILAIRTAGKGAPIKP